MCKFKFSQELHWFELPRKVCKFDSAKKYNGLSNIRLLLRGSGNRSNRLRACRRPKVFRNDHSEEQKVIDLELIRTREFWLRRPAGFWREFRLLGPVGVQGVQKLPSLHSVLCSHQAFHGLSSSLLMVLLSIGHVILWSTHRGIQTVKF